MPGADGGLVAAFTVAVQGRRAQRQCGQAVAAAGRVARIERHGAIEIDGVARGQRQHFEPRRAATDIATQEPGENFLVQGQAARQHATRRRLLQRGGRADIDCADRQRQVAGSVAHRLAQVEHAIDRRGDGAFGVQPRCRGTRHRRAGADADRPGGLRVGRQHIQAPIGQRQQRHRARLEGIALRRIHRRRAASQRRQPRAGLDFDLARRDQDLGRGQLRTGPQDHPLRAALEGVEAAALSILDHRQGADHQPVGTQGRQRIRLHRCAAKAGARRLAGRQDFHLAAAAVERRGAGETARRRPEIGNAVKAQRLAVGRPREYRQPQRARVGRQHRARHAPPDRVGTHEAGVAGLVVLRIGSQHGGRRQDHLARQTVGQGRAGSGQRAAGRP